MQELAYGKNIKIKGIKKIKSEKLHNKREWEWLNTHLFWL